MHCNKCGEERKSEFYASNKTGCKSCIRASVKANREANAEYYREYDAHRFKNDPKVIARHKRYQKTEVGKESVRKAKAKWQQQNPIKRGANILVGNAIASGKLIKPCCCSNCGFSNPRIHAHHDNYAEPLNVRWLCPACHKQWHRDNGEGANS